VAQVNFNDMKGGNEQPMDVMYVQRCCLRHIHEVLFSLNVALGVVLGLEFGYDGVFVPIFRLEQILYHQVGLKGGGGATSGHLALFLCTVLLTALLALLVRCFRRTSVMDYILVSAAGFVALGVAPACWFYINHRCGWSWYPAETAVYSFFAVLYLFRKWTMPAVVTILIVSVHYGFWYLRFWEYPHGSAELLAPIVGFCACFVWGIDVPVARARSGLAARSGV